METGTFFENQEMTSFAISLVVKQDNVLTG